MTPTCRSQAERCAATLEESDPRFYTDRELLADLDDMRQALGYDRINLWGGSWGTRAALLYALRYPASRRARSHSTEPFPLTMGFPRTASTSAPTAIEGRSSRVAGPERNMPCGLP